MFRKKHLWFISVLVLIMMLISLAAQATGMTNFVRKTTFSDNTFKDISKDKWYYTEIANAYEYGLVGGQGNGIFNPNGKVTIAEAITFAARINSIFHGKDAVITPTDQAKWYSGYIEYAKKNSIISSDNWDFDKPASREIFGLLLSRSLPDTEFASINDNIVSIPDFSASQYNFYSILKLFKAGIITGSDEYARFNPADSITRAEAATILNRTINPSQRKIFTPLAGDVNLRTDGVTINKGESVQIKYSYLNQSNGSSITWHTSDPSIATVSPDGLITAVGSGTATIWCTNSKDVKNSPDLSVTVIAAEGEKQTSLTPDSILSSVSPAVFTIEGTSYTYHQSPQKVSGTLVYSKMESGFFIDTDGTAVVSLHFIDTLKKVKVTTADGQTYTNIDILGVDRVNDIALIKVNANRSFAALKLGDFTSAGVKDTVYYVYLYEKSYTIKENSIALLSQVMPSGLENSEYIRLLNGIAYSNYEEMQKLRFINGCPLVNSAGEAIGVCLNDIFLFAKNTDHIKNIQRFPAISLETYVKNTYGKIAMFGQSIVKVDSASSYEKAFSLPNGNTALMTFSKTARKFYLRYIASSAGMMYVALVNKNPQSTSQLFPNAPAGGLSYQINSPSISNTLVDSNDCLIDFFHRVPRNSYKQMWLPQNGNYVFEIEADDDITGEYYLHWYFIS